MRNGSFLLVASHVGHRYLILSVGPSIVEQKAKLVNIVFMFPTDDLPNVLIHWDGPVSIALFTPRDDYVKTLKKIFHLRLKISLKLFNRCKL